MTDDPISHICTQKIKGLKKNYDPINRMDIIYFQLIRAIRNMTPGSPTLSSIRDTIHRNLTLYIQEIEVDMEKNYIPREDDKIVCKLSLSESIDLMALREIRKEKKS
jgi:hypothetical protein